MTHADKYFRNATDEEIAHIIVTDWCELINCECQMWRDGPKLCTGRCEERVLAWLKEEVQDGNA